MARGVQIEAERWPLKSPFVISRGSRYETHTVQVTLTQDGKTGRGECVPTPRYDESVDSVISQIESISAQLTAGISRAELQRQLPAGAARNAVDTALWDLEAKLNNTDVASLCGLDWPSNVPTVQTISLLSPQKMGQEARRLCQFPTLKLKLDRNQVIERVRAVHQCAPLAKLLIDANESWDLKTLQTVSPRLAELGVEMIEQPLPATDDHVLSEVTTAIPIYADESCHSCAGLAELATRYDGINIKLDKAGGLTEAIALAQDAGKLNLEIMIGCMVSTSLGIAPAMFLAPYARYLDLDAPALIKCDRDHKLCITNGVIDSLPRPLWGAH